MRVLYFTIVPLMLTGNGGSLCCRNHVTRLAADPEIELFAMVAGPPEWQAGTDAFFAELGIKHHFQPFHGANARHEANSLRSIASFAATMIFQFPWEVQALNQGHIQEGIDWAIRSYSIDALVIDYHPSALFLKLPRTDVRTAIIGLNREGDFYRDQIELGQTHHGSLTAPISLYRSRQFERRTNSSVGKVITIGSPDLPKNGVKSPAVCITPYLDAKPKQWDYSGTRSAMFVGSVHHYPNRLAISWISELLAPAMLELGSDIRLTIVGAAEADVPEKARLPNIDFLGPSDSETVASLFQSADLMLCPIENDYGVKFKAAEALAYNTPLLASKQTLLGFPYLKDMPAIDLTNPQEAATTLCNLIDNPDKLRGLARSQERQQRSFVETQNDIWSRTLRAVPLFT